MAKSSVQSWLPPVADDTPEKAMRIYDTQYREQYEKDHLGDYAAIDADSGEIYHAEFPGEVMDQAMKAKPKGRFYVIRVGHKTTFQTSVA